MTPEKHLREQEKNKLFLSVRINYEGELIYAGKENPCMKAQKEL